MKIGRANEKVSFIRFGQVSDGAGGYIPAEEELLSTWAEIEQLKYKKDIEQVQLKLPTAYRVNILYRKAFTPDVGMLVKWRGKNYEIITTPTIDDVRMGKVFTFDISTSG